MAIKSRKGCKDKKKRKAYLRQPCSEETKEKIRLTGIATRERQAEELRVSKLDIREQLGEYIFGRGN